MALKKIVTKAEHAKLPKDIQGEYKADADGENFTLDLEGGFEDTTALKNAKEHEKKARLAAEKAAKEATDKLAELEKERDEMLAGSIPKADAEKLRKSYDDKIAKLTADSTAALSARDAQLHTLLVDNVAQGLASEISTSPAVIMPHIKSRLKVEQVDGKFITRVIGADGTPSASTVEDLKKEFLANKDFAPIITASKASGGGAKGGGGGGGAPSKIDYTKASAKEIAEHLKASGKIPAATE